MSRQRVAFRALEYHADTRLAPADYRIEGSEEGGFRVFRQDRLQLELGPGYELLETRCCGVCSTDLDRHFLPFPLPQVTGHELVARRADGTRCAVEINASHAARGVASDCAFCAAGLASHCPERLVLGIHDLPGGFGPFVLAPRHALWPLPDALPDEVAVLLEPFAAAHNAVLRIAPRRGDVVAVLGPRRLGLLVVAALAAWRRASGTPLEIVALARHAPLRELARRLGADAAPEPPWPAARPLADVVVDTTGQPAGLEQALALAAREVHLKSTHGQPSCGLAHTTELVVDELALTRAESAAEALLAAARSAAGGTAARPRIAWLAGAPPPPALAAGAELLVEPDASRALARLEARAAAEGGLPRADLAVVEGRAQIDAALRPRAGSEVSLVRPRGLIALQSTAAAAEADAGALVRAIAGRGLRLSGSRCGDFGAALALLEADTALAHELARLITHRFAAEQLETALRVARTPACIKAVVQHASGAASGR